MSEEILQLSTSINQYRLDARHPRELRRVMRKIEQGRLLPQEAKRWLRRIKPWVEEQKRCFNPFSPAPSQEELGHFDIELGELIENPGVRVGIRIFLKEGPKHVLVAGTTGSGKSNILRRLINGFDAINRAGGRISSNPGT